MTLIERLKRRKLVQWLIAYAAAAWLVLQFTDVIGDQFQWSLGVQRGITIALAFGFVVAAVVAWYHGERGHQRVQGIEAVLIGVVLLAAGATIKVVNSTDDGPELDVATALSDFLQPDSNKVLVVPFRVAGAVPDLAYLHQGMMDLVHSRLSGLGGLRAIDPRTTMAQLGSATEGSRDYAQDLAIRVAQELGAGFLILGEVIGTPDQMSLSASLLDVPNGDVVGRATVEGPQDSLTALVNRLAVSALQTRAGEEAFAIDAALPAVQAYLSGRQLERQGRAFEAVEAFDRALEQDSTLTRAAFGLREVGFGLGTLYDVQRRGNRLLAARLDQMSPRDQAYARVLVRGDADGAGHLDNIERAVSAEPEHARLWHELGKVLVNYGAYIDAPDWASRAHTAIERALLLEPGHGANYIEGMRLHFITRDTVGLRDLWSRSVTASADTTEYRRWPWQVAVALEDEDLRAEAQSRGGEYSRNEVAYLLYGSMLNGWSLEYAQSLLAALPERAATERERFLAEFPLRYLYFTQGRVDEAGTLFGVNDLSGAAGMWALIFGFQDYAEAKAEVLASMAQRIARATRGLTPLHCRYYVSRGLVMGDTVGLRSFLEEAEDSPPFRDTPCPPLIKAIIDVHEPDAGMVALEQADSLMRRGPGGARDVNLALAQLFESHGEPGRALAALRRRQHNLSADEIIILPHYLREEGRLAALVGDTAGAIQAYGHYLTLRTDPDPELQPEVDRVREAYEALGGPPLRQ